MTLLYLTLIYLLIGSGVDALPIIAAVDASDPASSTGGDGDKRTVPEIVWSCILTVYLCTWVSMHPNIPGPSESWFRVTWRRTWLVALALISPELVIVWAMRQWFVAGAIAKKYQANGEPFINDRSGISPDTNLKGWTRTHGFFALMGGFTRYHATEQPYILSPDKLGEYLDNGNISISENEIQDRSKGDGLAKAFTIVQTLWFVLQCIARAVQHLPVTELEVATLAFVAANIVTYALWWKKPLNVLYSQPVCKEATSPAFPADSTTKQSHLRPTWYDAPFLPFGRLAGLDNNEHILTKDMCKVPTFYTGPNDLFTDHDKWKVFVVSVLVATTFGCIHCIAWFFLFPSYQEQQIWHIASIIISATPLGGVLLILLLDHLFGLESPLKVFVLWLLSLAYIGARLILIVLPFVTLRNLPPAAFQTVNWTTFIPHV